MFQGLGGQMFVKTFLEIHFCGFLGLVAKLFRRLLEVHFSHFRALLLAEWHSGSIWMLILTISGPSWPHGSQEASGDSL